MTIHERAEQAAEQLYDDATILEIDGPWRERWTAIVEAALTAQLAELRGQVEQLAGSPRSSPLVFRSDVLALIDAQGKTNGAF